LKDSIELPDYIAWDSIDDDGITDDDGDGVVSVGLEEITDELLRISITDINMSAIEYALYELENKYNTCENQSTGYEPTVAAALLGYNNSVIAWQDAVASGSVTAEIIALLVITMEEAEAGKNEAQAILKDRYALTSNALTILRDAQSVHEEAARLVGLATAGDGK